ncbi:MAG: LIC_10190 family membrane protein [Leptolyngbyaceae cyanobacterium]
MLYSIAVWILLGLASWAVGLTVLKGLQIRCFTRPGDRFIIAICLGLVLLSNVLLALAFITALSFGVGIGVGICTLLLVYCWRAELNQFWRTLSPSDWSSLLAVVVIVAYYTSRKVTWIDAGLYHFGATRWLAEFGAVPGVALLLDNFGFTSAWFALTAPLSPAAIAPRVSAVTNGFVLLMMMLTGLMALRRCSFGRAWVTDWFMVASLGLTLPILFLTTFMSAILVSPSPDIPVIFLTLMVAWSLLTVINHRSGAPAQPMAQSTPQLLDGSLVPLILATGALSIKLTALPLVPVTLLFYWTRKSDAQRLLVGSAVTLLLLLPIIAMGAVTSGCPFYPVSTFCLDLPWTLSTEQANEAAEVIQGWNRWFGTPPAGAHPLFWRIGQWLQFAKLNSIMVLLLLVAVILLQITRKAARRFHVKGILWLFGLGIVGMGFILLQAPMIRFGLGYFVAPTAVAIAVFISNPSPVLSRWRPKLVQLLPVVAWGTVGLIVFSQRSQLGERLILPPAMPSTRTVVERSHDVTYLLPVNERKLCWTAPLPCSRGVDNIQLRNPEKGIEAGFAWANGNKPDD